VVSEHGSRQLWEPKILSFFWKKKFGESLRAEPGFQLETPFDLGFGGETTHPSQEFGETNLVFHLFSLWSNLPEFREKIRTCRSSRFGAKAQLVFGGRETFL